MSEDIEQVRSRLKAVLGREPEVEKLKTGKFIAKYVEYGMSPLSLVGDTEAAAFEKLAQYLENKKKSG